MASPHKRKEKGNQTESLKVGRVKAVGDSFTLPTEEHKHLAVIKKNCLGKSVHVTKSEIIRVGLLLTRDLSTAEFLRLWKTLHKLNPGRPRKPENRK